MAKIKQLRENNIPFYPVTIPDAIVFENGDNLNEKVSNLENELDTIEQLIPEQANPQNQLADKEFVNSSIATNTAQFRGTFNTLNELNAVEADTNDYGFVVDTDASGNTLYNRYKYNGDSWVFEYTLNNSSFTAEQWEAINSGITTSLVDKLTELPTNSQLTETFNSKADKATTVTNVAYSNNKITKTINGVTSDVVSIDTIKHDLNLTKSDVGLSNVDNTSDADKPISIATQNALDGKIDKVNGKGLSTNDYTTDDKNKLHSIADGAQVNVLEGVKVNGTELTIDNEKKVNVIVPTKTSDLTNDDNTVKDPNYVHTDNNFTDVYKNKVDNSQENVIEHIKVNGTEQQIVEKTVDITVPTDLSDLNDDANHRLVTDAEKTAWNAKYDKPSGGIPKADLSNSVQRSLDKADTALQEHQDISGKADKSSLATVATTGKYEDLIGGPDLTGYATEQWVTNQNYITDVSGKADKSEMSVSTNGDKTTIQLKAGTSATVINAHQDISGKQDVITDLNTIRSGAAAGATAYQKPSTGIPKSDLATDVQTSLNKADTALQSHQDLSHITNLIPTQASSSNQLADKDFVNSSVSTATATFRGTSAAGLNQTQLFNWANGLTKDLNDYVFWNTTDSNGNTVYKRYKYDGTNWVFEYDLNNSSFTSEQWSAINSGITNTHVTKLNGIADGAEVNVQSDWNETNTSSDAYIKNKPANLVQDANYVHTDNNYTTTEKNKLSGIASNAQVNVLEGVQVNGTDLTITNKKVNVSVPTKTSQLTNDDNVVKDASYVHTDNNYTTTEKNKLSGIASGAQVNVIEGVQVNGTDLPITTNKKVNVDLSGKVDKVSGKGLSTYDVVDYAVLIDSVNDKSESQITLRRTGSSVNNNVTVGTTIAEKTKIENSVTNVQINGVTQAKSGSVVNLDLSNKVNVAESVSRTDDEFVYRQTGDGLDIDANNARIDKIKGKTLVWNQLVENGNFADTSHWNLGDGVQLSVFSNVATISKNVSAYNGVFIGEDIKIIQGHKYIYCSSVKCNNTGNRFRLLLYGGSSAQNIIPWTNYSEWTNVSLVFTSAATNNEFRLYADNGGDNTQTVNISIKNVIIVDLTLMFGEGNEPTTVEEFESMFPGYHEYNDGKLISNDAESIETVGFNQWDEEWEHGDIEDKGIPSDINNNVRCKNMIEVKEGKTYFAHSNSGDFYIWGMDANKQPAILLVHDGRDIEFTIPKGVRYLYFCMWTNYGTTYNHDICINISDPAKNGTYEPYKKSKINLNLNSFKVKDSQGNIITINGGLKSAGSVYDEIVGNKYIKRIGEVDLGTLNWDINTLPTSPNGFNAYFHTHGLTVVCSKYICVQSITSSGWVQPSTLYYGHSNDNYGIVITESNTKYPDSNTFKTAMSGVMLYYELATPIEYEIIAPTNFDYPVDKLGTERVISDTVPTPPFRADITYHESNIKDIEIEGITEYLKRSELSDWITSNKPTYSLSEITNADDVKAIENLTGTGLLKRTGDNTWALDSTSYASASALSGYLPLTGGTLTGELNIRDSSLNFVSSTAGSLIHRLANSSNHQPSWFDGTSWKTIAYAADLNDYVRKSGDVITGQIYMNNSYFIFRTAESVNIGHLNARASDNALIWYDTTKWNTVWHSGNSNLSTVDWNAKALNTNDRIFINCGSDGSKPTIMWNKAGNLGCIGYSGNSIVIGDCTNSSSTTFANTFVNITTGGNVGIGTSSPAYKLDVHGISASNYMLFYGTDGTTVQGYVGRAGSVNNTIYLDSYNKNNISIAIGGGKVGIGTASPSSTLSLYTNGTTNETNITLTSDGTGGDIGSIYIQKESGNGFVFAELNRDFIWRVGEGSTAGGGGTERMRLNNAGNLGIGISSPSYMLDVNGAARATQIITPSISNSSGISITADYIGLEATGDSLDFTSPDSFNFSGGGDMYITNNNVYANGFVKTGGTSSQFLKADGSVDSNTYLSTASLSGYLPLTGGTITGSLTVNNRITTRNIGSGSYQNWHIKDDSDINSSSNNLEIYTEDELRINAGSIEMSADDITINNVYDLNFGQIKISTYQNTFIIDNTVTKSRYLIHLDGTNSGDYVEFERY